MNINCPYCQHPVEHGKSPGTKASKYARTGPYFLCPNCSSPIEINLHFEYTGKYFLFAFFGSMLFSGLYYYVAAYHERFFGIATFVFISGLIGAHVMQRHSKKDWPKWRKRLHDL